MWTRRALVVAVVVLAASPALARPDARTMTCDALNRFIARHGAVVMTTGRYTYQRFVASRRFCDPWQVTQPVYQVTRDRKRCVVYSTCIDPPYDFPPFGDGVFD